MNRLDLVGGKVLVVEGLQRERGCCRVVTMNPKLDQDLTPRQLPVRDLVVPAMLDNAIEELVKINVSSIDLRFGIEPGGSLRVEISELGDELFVLGGPVDKVFCDPIGGRHHGRVRPRGRRTILRKMRSKPTTTTIYFFQICLVRSSAWVCGWIRIRVARRVEGEARERITKWPSGTRFGGDGRRDAQGCSWVVAKR